MGTVLLTVMKFWHIMQQYKTPQFMEVCSSLACYVALRQHKIMTAMNLSK